MAIPQINQITSVLRDMPDAQLQQYAAMHKNDPYVLSLAVAESNARKQLRASQQAKMAGQKPPTVVEQDLMAMAPQPQLPEQQGIGALPTPNVAHMADGGIAGYDDTPEQLVYNNEPVMRMAAGGHVQRFNEKGQVKGDPGFWDVQETESPFSVGAAYDRWRASGKPLLPYLGLETTTTKKKKLSADEERDLNMRKVAEETRTQPAMMNDPRRTDNPASPNVVKLPEEKKQTALEKATADNASAAPARTPAGPAASAFPATLGQFTPSTPEELSVQAEKVSANRQKESDAAYKPYAEMLQKERADLEGRKEGNIKDAMLRAGLAMMAGKSQYAMQNIGEGGIQGVNAYQEAKRADDAAKKALMGSEIALMQAQRAERSGNHKDAIALMGQAQQQKEFGVTAAMKAQELKQTGEYQRGMVGAANAKMDLMRDAYGLKDRQILAKYAQQAENNLVKSEPMWSQFSDEVKRQKVQAAMRTLLSADPNYAHLASGIGFSATPNNALVRTLNKDEE